MPPIMSGNAFPAPVFGIVCPSTLALLLLGADVDDAVGEADGDADDVGKIPTPGEDEPEGLGEGEADALGDVCAFTRVAAAAAADVNMSTPVANMRTDSAARARGTVLRIGGLLSYPLTLAPCAASYAQNAGFSPARIRQNWK
jgi:hypothetical protein